MPEEKATKTAAYFSNGKFGVQSFKASSVYNTLRNMLDTYESILEGYIPAGTETKKAVQNSIKELCAAICDLVKDKN